jgi:hypothetical protein
MSRREKAKAAIDQVSSLFPPPQARDQRAFIAAAAMLLAEYQDWLIEEFAHPTRGIVSNHKFYPDIAEMKEWLEQKASERWRRNDIRKRYGAPLNQRAQIEGPPALKRKSMRQELCEKYDIPDIPKGWDAIDVVRNHHRWGAEFRSKVQELLKD